ncbi:MAG: Phosphoenolpyruvate synthase [Deltaproteobacteria bacterium ADurb.Bin207]|nr:MAG: Phosphoenolpyruvate synthase [Deltaproteobacteria bacterium ADurb.Bin207]
MRLAWLHRHGFRTPRGWILPATVFSTTIASQIPSDLHPRALIQSMNRADALSQIGRARERWLSAPLPPSLVQELEFLWETVSADAPWGLAVRSSATCEDSELTAMAGLATSVLGVRGVDGLIHAIREVWASAFLPRSLQHLAFRGIRDLAMGVVLQVMVRAEASGVMFTRPPAGTDDSVWASDERLINATLGLGAPVVNGAVVPDVVRLRKNTRAVVHQTIAVKDRSLMIGDHGPDYVSVPLPRACEPALSTVALHELSSLADALEQVENNAFDVEFAVQNDEVFLVQARPIVGSGFPPGGDENTVWSRANVGEALPGVATPLTWSVAQDFSERGFHQAFRQLGCVVPRGATMVANIHGRFYLNLTSFMRIAAQVPGLRPERFVDLGGGTTVPQLEDQIRDVSHAGFLRRLPITASRVWIERTQLASRVARFERSAGVRHRAWTASALQQLDDRRLANAFRDVLQQLDHTGTLMLACASSSLGSHLALEALLRLLSVSEPQTTAQSLTAGVDELESAKPGMAIAKIASLVRRNQLIKQGILSASYQRIEDIPQGPVRHELLRFVEDFGDRAVREAELATARWAEDHSQIMGMLAVALHNPDSQERAGPLRARRRADHTMARLERELPWWKASAIRTLVGQARQTMILREKMRAWVTRCLGAIRRVALEIDCRLRKQDPRLEPGSAFFCTTQELMAAMDKGSMDLFQIVQMRRAEYARDERRADPPVTFVGRPRSVVLPPAGKEWLRGLGASPGVVEGKVRLLAAGNELKEGIEPGEILVARTTDVGLTPLFLLAAGVVTELGGPLSHAALVAREYGVPAVVNVAGVTVALRTGERIRIDGDRGIVERLEA